MQDLMPPVNTPDKLFHDGDPTQGIEGTIVTAEWLNDSQGATRDAQQELKNVLAAASLAPDESKQNQLVTAIQALISSAITAAKYVPDVGELYITKSQTNPNEKWPGTTWDYLGEGLTLRTAKADFSNIGQIVGADTVTLVTANLPAHTHTIGGNTGSSGSAYLATTGFDYGTKTASSTDLGSPWTSSFDYGSKVSDTTGDHSHGITTGTTAFGGAVSAGTTVSAVTAYTGNSGSHYHTTPIGAHSHSVPLGAHNHTVAIGAHSHNVTTPDHTHALPANTGSQGSGTSFGVVNKSILIAVWCRTA